MSSVQLSSPICSMHTIFVSFTYVHRPLRTPDMLVYVTNPQNYTLSVWYDDIQLAQEAHIDAFALNMAYADPSNTGART